MNEARRAPLSHQSGQITTSGPPDSTEVLARALRASASSADTLTHGFHSYPARMHPGIVRALLDYWTSLQDASGSTIANPKISKILDPFCGSGTVLVESRVRGLPSTGVDLNPLALRVAEAKTRRVSKQGRDTFLLALARLVDASRERVQTRKPVVAKLPKSELQWYDPHVLKELAGLLEEIQQVESDSQRRLFEVLFSAIVIKFSKQTADTSQKMREKRIRKGLVTEFFERKGEELVRRWKELDDSCGAASPRPEILEGDARKLSPLLGGRTVELVLTSPPYGGTYDYIDHHSRRYPWLGLKTSRMLRLEIGSRRKLGNNRDGEQRWDAELGSSLRSIRGVVTDSADLFFLLGDAQVGGHRVDADVQLHRLAPKCGFRIEAEASQARPDWGGKKKRREHLFWMKPI
ncbi:MAG: hypothetical protein AAF355_15680 [Myxococcota bacterium]